MSQPQILINQMSYTLPNSTPLITKLTMAFSRLKTGLVGRNGVGKSTLIKLMLGELKPNAGSIHIDGKLAYVPQQLKATEEQTVGDLLGHGSKIAALERITAGSIDENDYLILNDDWDIINKAKNQLALFKLEYLSYDDLLTNLSGGEMTRLLLTKAFSSEADFILLDEPTNHLDSSARENLYHAIKHWQGGIIVVSHDRALLNTMECIVELTSLGATTYGGNYDLYTAQKTITKNAIESDLHDAKKIIAKNKASIQAAREKHDQSRSRGAESRLDGSIDKLGGSARKDRGDRSLNTIMVNDIRMTEQASNKLQAAKEKIEILEEINIDLPETYVPARKMIVDINNLTFTYPNHDEAIIQNYNLSLHGPERIALTGDNGSGKTTLIKLITAELTASAGTIQVGTDRVNYLDQQASLLNPRLTILENFLHLNTDAKEHDAYRCLASFLFRNVATQKRVSDLSGGEKLRALLACVLMSKQPPQLLMLDEPTNHLDLISLGCIESALKCYQGAMIVISHDQQFLENINITRRVAAPFYN